MLTKSLLPVSPQKSTASAGSALINAPKHTGGYRLRNRSGETSGPKLLFAQLRANDLDPNYDIPYVCIYQLQTTV